MVDGLSNRAIAGQYQVSRSSLDRHKADHLPQILAEHSPSPAIAPIEPEPRHVARNDTAPLRTHVEHRQAADYSHSVDVFAELGEQLDRLGKLFDAIHNWLSDPDDPTRYSIDPRAEDVTVIYYTRNEETTEQPRRRKAKLSTLLGRLEGYGLSIESTEYKHADPRELLVKVSAELRAQMQLRVTILEKLTGAQEIERFEAATMDAISEVAPDVRAAIVDNLRRRQPLRRIAGSPLG